MQIITFRRKFFYSFYLNYVVEFYFQIPNPEIRNQMLMIVCFKTETVLLTQYFDYSMCTSGTDTSHDRSTNGLKHKVSVALELILPIREAPAQMNRIVVVHSFKDTFLYMK